MITNMNTLNINDQLDITQPDNGVEILISAAGVVWVYVDGILRLRVGRTPTSKVTVDDRRKKRKKN
ncbi:MAG TPA: hypothetical protein VE957_19725 [Terriglobales bacterium]|nr:hypothetical protein [Terriglobales bacterium]